jgi:hypothetical protein
MRLPKVETEKPKVREVSKVLDIVVPDLVPDKKEPVETSGILGASAVKSSAGKGKKGSKAGVKKVISVEDYNNESIEYDIQGNDVTFDTFNASFAPRKGDKVTNVAVNIFGDNIKNKVHIGLEYRGKPRTIRRMGDVSVNSLYEADIAKAAENVKAFLNERFMNIKVVKKVHDGKA